MENCVCCGESTKFSCEKCGKGYCNKVCQTADWARHKNVCSVMPKLVLTKERVAGAKQKPKLFEWSGFINAFQDVAAKQSTQPESDSQVSTVKPCGQSFISGTKLSSVWRKHEVPVINQSFNCVITFMELDYIWVVPKTCVTRLQHLKNDMRRCVSQNNACVFKNLRIGDLIAAVIDNEVFRAEILSLMSSSNIVGVRLIDVGKKVSLTIEKIYPAVHQMSECKAFAIRVILVNSAPKLEIGKYIYLSVTSENTSHDGAYRAQLMRNLIPLGIPIKTLYQKPEITVVTVLQSKENEPQVALVKINGMEWLVQELNQRLTEEPIEIGDEFPRAPRLFFMAVRISAGFRRAFLLDYVETPKLLFLVYLMDEGRTIVSDKLFRLPIQYVKYPLRVFAVTLVGKNAPNILEKRLNKCNGELTFKYNYPQPKFETLRKYNATLFANGDPVVNVVASTFMGDIEYLGFKFWSEPIENKAAVYISHVFSYDKICVSAIKTMDYPEYFKHMENKCHPFNRNFELAAGCAVLVVNHKIGNYRGEVVQRMNGRFVILNVDNNSIHEEQISALRIPCHFIKCLPICAQIFILKDVCEVPAAAAPMNNGKLQMLQQLCSNHDELLVAFDRLNGNIDLISTKAEPPSLVARMMRDPVTEEGCSTIAEVGKTPAAQSQRQFVDNLLDSALELEMLKKSASNVSKYPPLSLSTRRLTENKAVFNSFLFRDVQKNFVPCGENMRIRVLRSIQMHKLGYITAAYFENDTELHNYQSVLDLVKEYGNANDNFMPGFLPSVGEMCLAMYLEDLGWYRGVCLEVDEQMATISFCDFGNIEVVPLSYLKPIPDDLIYPIYATKCFVKDFYEGKDIRCLEEYLVNHSELKATVEEGPRPNTRMIRAVDRKRATGKQMIDKKRM